ncbi:MAG TPA: hypothetical protein VFR49_00035 [Solirubrobacteraceae bacterium]|nr:hypothetical protein [Solirubrobacteraceae bacterium]
MRIRQSLICRIAALWGGVAGGTALGRGQYAVAAVLVAGAVFLWWWSGRLAERERS